MPELPEVETTRRSLLPHLCGTTISAVTVRNPRLRWPVPADLAQQLTGQCVRALERRGKYLLARFDHGTLLLHLGMSGSLRLAHPEDPWRKHDHLELGLDNGWVVRLHDPRRFGACLWTTTPATHPLLLTLGVEPLAAEFTPEFLLANTRGKSVAIKLLLMNAKIVVGVGNIYANEALFRAQLHPTHPAGQLNLSQLVRLQAAVQSVLTEAITTGGTTLRDFVHGQGDPGYFQLSLQVYGRAGQACLVCQTPVQRLAEMTRATYCCPHCQPCLKRAAYLSASAD